MGSYVFTRVCFFLNGVCSPKSKNNIQVLDDHEVECTHNSHILKSKGLFHILSNYMNDLDFHMEQTALGMT